MAALLPGLGLFGTLITTRRRKPLTRKHFVGISVLGLLLLASLFTLGCGGSNAKAPVPSQTTSNSDGHIRCVKPWRTRQRHGQLTAGTLARAYWRCALAPMSKRDRTP